MTLGSDKGHPRPFDRELIDMTYLLDVLRNDWGFTYTVLDNLKKCEDPFARFEVPPEVTEYVGTRINAVAGQIVSAPKSTRWKLRARLGTRSKWFEDVDDVNR